MEPFVAVIVLPFLDILVTAFPSPVVVNEIPPPELRVSILPCKSLTALTLAVSSASICSCRSASAEERVFASVSILPSKALTALTLAVVSLEIFVSKALSAAILILSSFLIAVFNSDSTSAIVSVNASSKLFIFVC